MEDENYRSYEVLDDISTYNTTTTKKSNPNDIINIIHNDIIGNYQQFTTSFGIKPLIYIDWTASGRCLHSIERYIYENVLTYYGNTHTSTSRVSHQSTCFRHESRQIISESVNAKVTGKAALDVVLFTGSGTTSAVNKLVQLLDLNEYIPQELDENIYRPVVFISSYEHHSNILPFRESIAEVITIAYNNSSGVDLIDLQYKLSLYKERKIIIGAFSAASNITGVLTDVNSVSILIHKAGGLVFFDYATAAPYVKIDMNPVLSGSDSNYVYKDGIYFSGHKFIGGPGSPGVLILKKNILPSRDEAPTRPGGGTVFYVTDSYHRYLSNREEREEGGTPDIIGDIRLGLALHTKQQIDINIIEKEEFRISNYVQEKLSTHPNIILLGRSTSNQISKLPIFSFLISYKNKYFHYNYISVLLNDLFGLQTRGGCQCAGPFSQLLLGINQQTNEKFEKALLNKNAVYRPGFTRFSTPYWMSSYDIDYVIDCILFIAEHAWKYLHLYRFNPKTGEWAHTTRLTKFPERIWLSNYSSYESTTNEHLNYSMTSKNILNHTWKVNNESELYNQVFNQVKKELIQIEKTLSKKQVSNNWNIDVLESHELSDLLWFVLPNDLLYNEIDKLGPINPINEEKAMETSLSADQTNDTTNERSVLTFQTNNYVNNQNEKMKKRYGNEKKFPRYINLINTSNSKVGETLDEIKSEEMIQVIGAINDINISVEKGVEVLENIHLSDSINTLPICATNTCFIQRKTINPSTNKVQSGIGSVYLPVNLPNDLTTNQPTKTLKLHKSMIYDKKLLKLVGLAIKEWRMISEGDRLLLGLSGGKDSMCLLHVLLEMQKRSPIKFELSCATVDPQTESYDPSPLISYVQSLGVTYHYLSEPIVELAKTKLLGDSLCAFCSRFKRGLLYSCCRNFGYNKLVLAQHLDDLAESFLMSVLHNGQLRTMKANYVIDAMDLSVIRPLIYVREHQTKHFSITNHLPVINENCPVCFEQPKERARIKQLLKQEEYIVPNLYYNLKHSLLPLMDNRTYDLISEVYKEIDEITKNNKKVYRNIEKLVV